MFVAGIAINSAKTAVAIDADDARCGVDVSLSGAAEYRVLIDNVSPPL